MSGALVSIIIPTYNSSDYVIETLDSVAAQAHRPIQLVIVDDGSSDGTTDLVQRWLERRAEGHGIRGKLVRQGHLGGGAARNLGIANAEGEWIQFLDSDDILGSDKVAAQLALLSGTTRTLAYCGWRFLVRKNGAFRSGELKQAVPLSGEADPLRTHLEGWYCPPHCYLWPRALLDSIGGWDPSLAADQDGDLIMRALAYGAQLAYCPGVEVAYRLHGFGQVSRSPSRSKIRSRLRVARKIARILETQGRLDDYRISLAVRCEELERSSCVSYPAFAKVCRRTSQSLAPGHRPAVRGGIAYRLARRFLGLYLSEWLAVRKQALMSRRGNS